MKLKKESRRLCTLRWICCILSENQLFRLIYHLVTIVPNRCQLLLFSMKQCQQENVKVPEQGWLLNQILLLTNQMHTDFFTEKRQGERHRKKKSEKVSNDEERRRSAFVFVMWLRIIEQKINSMASLGGCSS